VIGEILSGLIHHELRIENNENVVEQFIYVSSLLSEFLAEVSKKFNKVYVYVTPGNHSRVVANKEMSLRGENFDVLLPHYLKASLQNYTSIVIEDNMKDCDVAIFKVRNSNVFGVHGDKDEISNVVQRFTMIFGIKPDIVLMGHRHTNAMTTIYDAKVIQSGCVSGSDNYCLDRRLKNRPEQTVSVVDDDGLVCIYDVKVD
jgi:predicted phosphodiesterase